MREPWSDGLFASTVTPGSTPPDSSVAWPARDPVVWARAREPPKRKRRTEASPRERVVFMKLLPALKSAAMLTPREETDRRHALGRSALREGRGPTSRGRLRGCFAPACVSRGHAGPRLGGGLPANGPARGRRPA